MWFDARRALAEIEHSGQAQDLPQAAANLASCAIRKTAEPGHVAEIARIAAEPIGISGLPQSSEAGNPFETDFEERAAIVEYGASVPREWAEGYARLLCLPPPPGITPERWQQIIDDGGRFLDQWADQANRLGWTTLEVFGISPAAPEQRLDMRGLVPSLQGGRVVMLTDEAATIEANLRIFRRAESGAVPIWEMGTSECAD